MHVPEEGAKRLFDHTLLQMLQDVLDFTCWPAHLELDVRRLELGAKPLAASLPLRIRSTRINPTWRPRTSPFRFCELLCTSLPLNQSLISLLSNLKSRASLPQLSRRRCSPSFSHHHTGAHHVVLQGKGRLELHLPEFLPGDQGAAALQPAPGAQCRRAKNGQASG